MAWKGSIQRRRSSVSAIAFGPAGEYTPTGSAAPQGSGHSPPLPTRAGRAPGTPSHTAAARPARSRPARPGLRPPAMEVPNPLEQTWWLGGRGPPGGWAILGTPSSRGLVPGQPPLPPCEPPRPVARVAMEAPSPAAVPRPLPLASPFSPPRKWNFGLYAAAEAGVSFSYDGWQQLLPGCDSQSERGG